MHSHCTLAAPAAPAAAPQARPRPRRWRGWAAGAALLGALAACGGGGGGDAAAPPGASANQAPTARFDAPLEAVAGQPVAFDGRASSDPEGSTLRFTWQFGDGAAGGMPRIAHVYPAAGTYTARLVVHDAEGASAELARSVTVRPAAPALRQVPLAGRVTDLAGQPLSGVSVVVQGRSDGGGAALTDADGRAALTVDIGPDVVLRLSRPGYTGQVKRLTLPAGAGADADFEASLMPRPAARWPAPTGPECNCRLVPWSMPPRGLR
jgi:hypothetical protein